MITHMRYTLLMLAALLGHNIPPGRPPGHRLPEAELPPTTDAPCPGCQGQGRWEEDLYLCDSCDQPFYYCTGCGSFYQDGKEGDHEHESPVA